MNLRLLSPKMVIDIQSCTLFPVIKKNWNERIKVHTVEPGCQAVLVVKRPLVCCQKAFCKDAYEIYL